MVSKAQAVSDAVVKEGSAMPKDLELNDKEMLAMLDKARALYEDGAILEAAAEANKFYARIKHFEKRYAEANT